MYADVFGPDFLFPTSLVTVVDFINARNLLCKQIVAGQTLVGCTTDAFTTIGKDYLTRTIYMDANETGNVLQTEFWNESYQNQTIRNFVQFRLLAGTRQSPSNTNSIDEWATMDSTCG